VHLQSIGDRLVTALIHARIRGSVYVCECTRVCSYVNANAWNNGMIDEKKTGMRCGMYNAGLSKLIH